MLAAYHGHAPLVKLLIQHGADPNRLNDRGQSPLAGAVFKGEAEVVEVRPGPLLLFHWHVELSFVKGITRGRCRSRSRLSECFGSGCFVQAGREVEGEV